jgi:hypothetical protein
VWELEDRLIATLDLPLNLRGNTHNQLHPVLTGVSAGFATISGMSGCSQAPVGTPRLASSAPPAAAQLVHQVAYLTADRARRL